MTKQFTDAQIAKFDALAVKEVERLHEAQRNKENGIEEAGATRLDAARNMAKLVPFALDKKANKTLIAERLTHVGKAYLRAHNEEMPSNYATAVRQALLVGPMFPDCEKVAKAALPAVVKEKKSMRERDLILSAVSECAKNKSVPTQKALLEKHKDEPKTVAECVKKWAKDIGENPNFDMTEKQGHEALAALFGVKVEAPKVDADVEADVAANEDDDNLSAALKGLNEEGRAALKAVFANL